MVNADEEERLTPLNRIIAYKLYLLHSKKAKAVPLYLSFKLNLFLIMLYKEKTILSYIFLHIYEKIGTLSFSN